MGVVFSSFKDNYYGSWSVPLPPLPPQRQKRNIYHMDTYNICKMTSTYKIHSNLIKRLLKKYILYVSREDLKAM